VARAWWKFAIICVIKENREKATRKQSEFQISYETNQMYLKAFKQLIFKTLEKGWDDESKND